MRKKGFLDNKNLEDSKISTLTPNTTVGILNQLASWHKMYVIKSKNSLDQHVTSLLLHVKEIQQKKLFNYTQENPLWVSWGKWKVLN